MKYKVDYALQGTVARPYYEGTVTISTTGNNIDISDLRDMVFWKLKRTVFEDLMDGDLIIKNFVSLY